ncbi:MAG: hypothetical protein M3022_01030 [Actinomycetota bacterium]|nr:hypothetical protein [Actinomycetota bacterium]
MADPPIRSDSRKDPANDTGIPRWVKILGIIALRSPTAVVHAGGAVVLLLVATTLSVYKPRGLTRHGRRKQDEQPTMSERRGRGLVPAA